MLKFSFQRTKLAEFTHKGAVGLKYLQKEEEAWGKWYNMIIV